MEVNIFPINFFPLYYCQQSDIYGYGIAISGGIHDPSSLGSDKAVYVSDVIQSGPADGKLL
jgi:hypothetical protein